MTNTETLLRLIELAEKATPGPWVAEVNKVRGDGAITIQGQQSVFHWVGTMYLDGDWVGNAAFVAAARNAIPAIKSLLNKPEASADFESWWQKSGYDLLVSVNVPATKDIARSAFNARTNHEAEAAPDLTNLRKAIIKQLSRDAYCHLGDQSELRKAAEEIGVFVKLSKEGPEE